MDRKTKKLVMAGLLTAATFALTLISFPGGAGIWNAGDAAVFLTGTLLGGGWGAVCAAVGSALGDVTLGYTVYVPCTLLVKAGASLLCWWLYKKRRDERLILALILAASFIVAGYFFFEWYLLGLPTALGDIPFNALQSFAGALMALFFMRLTKSWRFFREG